MAFICKNNPKKTYTGNEPSPKGLGFCASGEKEGTKMKGKDNNIWIKKNGKWIRYSNNQVDELKKKLYKKLFSFWKKLSQGQIIIIYKNNQDNNLTYKFIKSNLKTLKAQSNDLIEKWKKYGIDKDIKLIIWSSKSIDSLIFFIEYLIKKKSSKELEEIIKIKNITEYIVRNYKIFFKKYKLYTEKDYILK